MRCTQCIPGGLWRIKGSDGDSYRVNLVEKQKKVAWKQQRERDLQAFPLWKRAYDYTVQLLARSLVTIFDQIKYVFLELLRWRMLRKTDSRKMNFDYINRSQSVSALMLSSVYPSENSRAKFISSPLSWD